MGRTAKFFRRQQKSNLLTGPKRRRRGRSLPRNRDQIWWNNDSNKGRKFMINIRESNYGHLNTSKGGVANSTFIKLVIIAFSMLVAAEAWAIDRWVDILATSPPGTGCGPLAGYKTIGAAIAASSPG